MRGGEWNFVRLVASSSNALGLHLAGRKKFCEEATASRDAPHQEELIAVENVANGQCGQQLHVFLLVKVNY